MKDLKDLPEHGILTEYGIDLCNGVVITEGKILEVVRKAKILLDNNQDAEFVKLINSAQDGWTDEECYILLRTHLSESSEDILWELCRIDIQQE